MKFYATYPGTRRREYQRLWRKNMLEFNKQVPLKEGNNDLLTIGELLIDLISEEYDCTKSSTYHRHFGGSPSNIAMNVRKLGYLSYRAASKCRNRYKYNSTGR